MGMSYFLLHFWKIVLSDIEFLADRFFFSVSTFNLSFYCSLSSVVSDENQLLVLVRITCRRQFTSVFLSQFFLYLCLSTICKISQCSSLSLSYLEFVELLGHVDSFFIKFEMFLSMVSSNIILSSFSFHLLGLHFVYVGMLDIVPNIF